MIGKYAPMAQMMLLPLVAMMRCVSLHVPQAHIMRAAHIICEANIMFRIAEHIIEKTSSKDEAFSVMRERIGNYLDYTRMFNYMNSEVCACGANEVVRVAHNDVLRLRRKMMRCVPLHVPQAHIMRAGHIICEANIMFRIAEHIIEKTSSEDEAFCGCSLRKRSTWFLD